MKKGFMITGCVLLLTLVSSLLIAAAAVEGDPFKGLELCIAYDFDFWPEDVSLGTKDDKDIFFSDASQAGLSLRYSAAKEGAFKDRGKLEGLAFKHESIWEAGQAKNYVAFTLSQRHDMNLYAFDEFPEPKYFSFYIDTTNYKRALDFYPIIYEQDYDAEEEEAGVSCMAIKANSTFYLKNKEGVITSAKSYDQHIAIPKNFVGRVYLPLKDYVPIWGTQDVNGKFDGLKVISYKFSFVDIGNKGEYIIFDEFAFLI